MLTRRAFARGLTLTGAAGLAGLRPSPVRAQPAPEIRKIRLLRTNSVCWAPQYLAEELLRAEGFTDVQYAFTTEADLIAKALATDKADISMQFVAPNIIRFEMGDPIVFLAGGHVGCIELRGTDQLQSARDLKGKTVAVPGGTAGSAYTFVEYDPEDAVRFYALRLHEAGLIKSTPQKILSQGTDWRFLNELKKEMKG